MQNAVVLDVEGDDLRIHILIASLVNQVTYGHVFVRKLNLIIYISVGLLTCFVFFYNLGVC